MVGRATSPADRRRSEAPTATGALDSVPGWAIQIVESLEVGQATFDTTEPARIGQTCSFFHIIPNAI